MIWPDYAPIGSSTTARVLLGQIAGYAISEGSEDLLLAIHSHLRGPYPVTAAGALTCIVNTLAAPPIDCYKRLEAAITMLTGGQSAALRISEASRLVREALPPPGV